MLSQAGAWEWLVHDLISERLVTDEIMSPHDWRQADDIIRLEETLNLKFLNTIHDIKEQEKLDK